MPLAAPLLQALAEKGYTLPSPIQARAIPVLLEGRDLLACAQTGTGKTAAFALPILHGIAQRNRQTRRHEVRSLILTPTRELAVQVADSFRAYGKNLRFRIGVVYGGMSQHPQVRALQNGLDVLVATPGRLLDLMEQGHVDLSGVGCFVLDEGDRMLDMGFIEDIRTIAAQLPAERQTMLFSATMAPEITRLAASLLRTPEEIRIAPQGTTAENIDQRVYFVQRVGKQALLFDLINRRMQEDSGALSLVFSRTKHGASKLADQLNRAGIRADAIHGDKTQAARQKALNRFRDGATPVLVATDVAARGIDVRNIGMVVNYDVPVEPDIYVHRIGRTARAGTSGSAVTFCSEDDLLLFRSVERFLKCTVPVEANHAHHAEAIAARHLSGSRDRHAQGGARKKTGGPAKYRSGPARSVSPYASGPGKKPFQKKPFRRGQFARAWQN
jgi:ATP-dependent RNA helicase RhlE